MSRPLPGNIQKRKKLTVFLKSACFLRSTMPLGRLSRQAGSNIGLNAVKHDKVLTHGDLKIGS
jgi:hypothetical protein